MKAWQKSCGEVTGKKETVGITVQRCNFQNKCHTMITELFKNYSYFTLFHYIQLVSDERKYMCLKPRIVTH